MRSFVKEVLFCVLISIVLSFVFTLLISLLTMFTDIPLTFVPILVSVAKIIALGVAIFLCFKEKRLGYLKGLFSAVLFELLAAALTFIMSGSVGFDVQMIIEFLFMCIFGFLLGALKVNLID